MASGGSAGCRVAAAQQCSPDAPPLDRKPHKGIPRLGELFCLQRGSVLPSALFCRNKAARFRQPRSAQISSTKFGCLEQRAGPLSRALAPSSNKLEHLPASPIPAQSTGGQSSKFLGAVWPPCRREDRGQRQLLAADDVATAAAEEDGAALIAARRGACTCSGVKIVLRGLCRVVWFPATCCLRRHRVLKPPSCL